MASFDTFRFDGKRVLVVGGATGMGAAAVDVALAAGADVIVMDYAPVTADGVTAIQMNLAERESIDEALAAVDGPIDALMSCAGVADGTPGIERINFVGHRYLIDALFARDALPRGSAIGFISSAAGLGWESNLPLIKEYLAITDFDAAAAWARDNGKADYMFSKQTICAYVACSAMEFLRRGVRINAICPGPTDTPLAQANRETWLGFGADYRAEVGVEASTSLEQAFPLVFLCSDAAAALTGQTIVTDAGYFAAAVTETFPAATPIANFLLGRM
jgi:NAD(P)-dependent dehydrogenase (short-subunit alcohol dehydrogenase family)